MAKDDEVYAYGFTSDDFGTLSWVFAILDYENAKNIKNMDYRQYRKLCYWHGYFDAHACRPSNKDETLWLKDYDYKYITDQLHNFLLMAEVEYEELQTKAKKLLEWFKLEHKKHC